jgi:hypothetical protein
VFGIPHAHVLRLVRVPRDQELGVVAPGEPGYLDTVLVGIGCRDFRASRSARLYAFGATLQEIGDLFGVTRERIHQILGRDIPWSSTVLTSAAKVLAQARRTEHESAVEHWSLTHPAAPLDEAPAALGLSVEQKRQALGRRRSRHEPAFDAPREATRRTEEEIIEDLRTFHAETGPHHLPGLHHLGARARRPRPPDCRDPLRHLERSPKGRRDRKGQGRPAQCLPRRGPLGRGALRRAGRGRRHHLPSRRGVARPASRRTVRRAHRAAALRPRGRQLDRDGRDGLAVLHTPEDFDPAWVEEITAPRDWDTPADEPDPLDHVRAAIDALGPRITTARHASWARAEGRPPRW